MIPWHWWLIFGLAVVAIIVVPQLVWRWLESRRFYPPDDIEAIKRVWSVYQGKSPRDGDIQAPPSVFWRRVKPEEKGWRDLWGRWVAGSTPTPWACNVAWWEGCKYHETALAHELFHAWLRRRGGDREDDPGFGPGGFVEQANLALMAWEASRG